MYRSDKDKDKQTSMGLVLCRLSLLLLGDDNRLIVMRLVRAKHRQAT